MEGAHLAVPVERVKSGTPLATKPGGAGCLDFLHQVDTSAFRATRKTVTMDFAENDLQNRSMKSLPLSGPLSLRALAALCAICQCCAGAAVVLSGCSTLQPFRAQLPPVAVPAQAGQRLGQGVATPLAQWWERLGDPELTALISEAWPPTPRCAVPRRHCSNRALVDVQTAGTLPRLGLRALAAQPGVGQHGQQLQRRV